MSAWIDRLRLVDGADLGRIGHQHHVDNEGQANALRH
jgi:hypothetical protein